MSHPLADAEVNTAPLGLVAEVTLGKMIQSSPVEGAELVPYIKAKNVRPEKVEVDSLGSMYATPAERVALAVRMGDIFVIEGGATAGRAAVVRDSPPEECIFQNAVHRVRAGPRMEQRFLYYVLAAYPQTGWYEAICSAATFKHLTGEKMARLSVPVPPLEVQRRVADMLDTETARIDTLIKKNERAIELVDLRTVSLISECVKHGVPSKRPQIVNEYRSTTPVWLRGSVWPIVKLGLLFEVRGGTTPPSIEENWNGPVMWATPVDLRPVHGGSIAETIRTLSVSGAKSAGLIESPSGCIIVSCRAPVGYAAINTVPMTTNQGCKTLYPTHELDVRFFRYQLQAFRNELESKGRGSTFVEVSSQALADFPVAVPPLTIQQSVANYLDAEIERHSAIRTAILYQQELLRLRRQSLITAAVTGQIEA